MNLRDAAQQALEALEDSHQNINPERRYADELTRQIADSITALRAALAEATTQESRQVEPMAWLQIGVGDHEGTVIATKTKPKTWNPDWWRFEPLYTAPPKREPLNTDLILARWASECVPSRSTPELVVAFARAIEQEHGIGGEE